MGFATRFTCNARSVRQFGMVHDGGAFVSAQYDQRRFADYGSKELLGGMDSGTEVVYCLCNCTFVFLLCTWLMCMQVSLRNP